MHRAHLYSTLQDVVVGIALRDRVVHVKFQEVPRRLPKLARPQVALQSLRLGDQIAPDLRLDRI
jgi:hypothetical protein